MFQYESNYVPINVKKFKEVLTLTALGYFFELTRWGGAQSAPPSIFLTNADTKLKFGTEMNWQSNGQEKNFQVRTWSAGQMAGPDIPGPVYFRPCSRFGPYLDLQLEF